MITLGDIITICTDLRDEEWDQIEKFGLKRNVDALILSVANMPGKSWVLREEGHGRAYVIGGVVPVRPGVVSSWCLVSNWGWNERASAVTAFVADAVAETLESGVHRIETLSLATREAAHRWYTKVGLHFESTLKHACVDGSDAVMYVATKGGA
jgi:hypothetical protein